MWPVIEKETLCTLLCFCIFRLETQNTNIFFPSLIYNCFFYDSNKHSSGQVSLFPDTGFIINTLAASSYQLNIPYNHILTYLHLRLFYPEPQKKITLLFLFFVLLFSPALFPLFLS